MSHLFVNRFCNVLLYLNLLCIFGSNTYYLMDTLQTVPTLMMNHSIVYSIEEAWNNIIIALNQSNQSNTAHPNQFTFNISIISNLNITQNSSISVPFIPNLCNKTITINFNCIGPSFCVVNVNNNAIFMAITQNNPNSPKIALNIYNLLINVHANIEGTLLNAKNISNVDIYLNNVVMYGNNNNFKPIFIQYSPSTNNTFSLNAVDLYNMDTPIHIVNGGHIILNYIKIEDCSSSWTALLYFENVISYNINNIILTKNTANHNLIRITMQSPIIHSSNNYFDGANIYNNTAAYGGLYVSDDYNNNSYHILSNIVVNGLYETYESAIIVESVSNVLISNTNISTFDIGSGISLYNILSAHIDTCNISHSAWGLYTESVTLYQIFNTNLQHNTVRPIHSSHSDHIYIFDSVIQHNDDGVQLHYVHNAFMDHCEIKHNANGAPFGGGLIIYILDTMIVSNSLFAGNMASREGGAVLVKMGRVVFNNCVFTQNTAYSGGAIGISVPTNLEIHYVSIHNSFFTNNLAHDGGSIWSDRGTYLLFNNTFTDNYAKSKGGAIFDAMSTEGCKINKTAIIGDYNVFIRNKAYMGGAVYTTNCHVYILGDAADTASYPVFEGNAAIMFGGGILFDVSGISMTNIVVSHANFINNTALLIGGGALVASGGNLWIINCTFRDNKATKNGMGGAILVQSLETFTDTNMYIHVYHCLLRGNVAANGGAVAVHTLSNMENMFVIGIIGSKIENNYALQCGGGIFIKDGRMLVNESQIEHNNAGICGGALHLSKDGSVQSVASRYVNNSANQYGGALSLSSSTFMFNGDWIENNYASQYGGAVFMTNCPVNRSQNIYLNNNVAKISGGGYFIENDAQCQWAHFIEFSDNVAAFGGNHATFPDHVHFVWDIPVEFTRSDTLSVAAILLNGFNETVTALADNDVFIMEVTYNTSDYFDAFELMGEDVATFDAEKIDISFMINPMKASTIFAKHIKILFTFNVSVSLNGELFKESKSAHFVNKLYEISKVTKVTSHVLNGICSFCIVVTAVLFVIFWQKPVIKGSRVPFMLIILFGLQIISVSLSYGMQEAHVGGCAIYIWLLILGVVTILAPISAKTWAIYHVFAYAEDLKDFMWDTKRLFLAFVLLPIVVCITYLSVWTAFDVGMIEVGYAYNTKYEYLATYCPFNYNFAMIPFIVIFLSLLLLSFLACRSRHVPENFNESKYLGLCIFTSIILLIMYCLITFLDFFDDSTQWLLRSLCFFILIQSVLTYLFYFKLFIVYNDKEIQPIFDKTHSVFIKELEANSKQSISKKNKLQITNEYAKVQNISADACKSEDNENDNNSPGPALELQELQEFARQNTDTTFGRATSTELMSPYSTAL